MNPGGHMHSKLCTPSTQLPLFEHGAEKHSSISAHAMDIIIVIYQQRTIQIRIMTFVSEFWIIMCLGQHLQTNFNKRIPKVHRNSDIRKNEKD